ncbi:MAG: sigma-70 family RNA polymerase sigma factor [Planctomycetota bacterium]
MHEPPRDPDAELVRACGDPNSDAFELAFETLYTRYRDRVYGIAYRITGNSVDALDAEQEAFALLFRKISAFRFGSLFSTWLFRLVVNCSIDVVRSRCARRQAVELGSVPEHESPVGDEVDPQVSASRNELGGFVQAALNRISPKLRAVLALRYLEGMSYEELCDALGVSMGTVKSRLARAHVAMENVLRRDPVLQTHFGEVVA